MSPNQSDQKKSKHVHSSRSNGASLPRRFRSQIRLWRSHIAHRNEHHTNTFVEPQQLEAGLGRQNIAGTRVADSEDISDTILPGFGTIHSAAGMIDKSINNSASTLTDDYCVDDAHKRDDQSHDYYSNAMETAGCLTKQPPEYTAEARTLVHSFTIGDTNANFKEPRLAVPQHP